MLTGIEAEVNWALTVRTLLGQEVLFQTGQGQTTLNLGRLPAGTYLGQMQTEGGASQTLRLIVR